jgi:hypothetical protein
MVSFRHNPLTLPRLFPDSSIVRTGNGKLKGGRWRLMGLNNPTESISSFFKTFTNVVVSIKVD